MAYKTYFSMRYILMLAGFSIFTISLFGQAKQPAPQQIMTDVIYLSSDYLEGREPGTKGETLAAAYIKSRFASLGLAPKGTDGYFQPFTFKEMRNPHAAVPADYDAEKPAKNIVAYLDNKAPTTVVIGAHYDHLGYGGANSLFADKTPTIHNGADDNASGVASLLYLAEALTKSDLKQNNYLFIAFSAEEKGLIGSKYFVNNPTIDLAQVNYMLNMDMVGSLVKEKVLVINAVGTSPVWKPTFDKIDVGGITLSTTESGIGPSDHTSFYLKDIPALHFFTGGTEYYHKPSDDASTLNFEGIHLVSNYILALIKELDDAGKIKFSKTKDEEKKVSSFKVTLGVLPDYTHSGEGMRLDGVLEGRPAQVAGLEKGDVIIKIDDMDIKDIYAYMDALSKFEKGEKAKVVVLRDGKKVKKTVTF